MKKQLFTSESVTEGHPDKVCDIISDSILDEMLRQDPLSRVACETFCTTGLVAIMGEVTTHADVDLQKVVRDAVRGRNSALTATAARSFPPSMSSRRTLRWALTARWRQRKARATGWI